MNEDHYYRQGNGGSICEEGSIRQSAFHIFPFAMAASIYSHPSLLAFIFPPSKWHKLPFLVDTTRHTPSTMDIYGTPMPSWTFILTNMLFTYICIYLQFALASYAPRIS